MAVLVGTIVMTQAEYIAQLKAELADLNPTGGGWNSIDVGSMTVQVNLVPSTNDRIKSVLVTTPYRFGRGKHRFTKVADVKYIAGQVRRLIAEDAAIQESRRAYSALSAARRLREEAAGATLKALVEANPTAYEFDVDETVLDGERVMQFAIKLKGLTEAQALAVMVAVGGKV